MPAGLSIDKFAAWKSLFLGMKVVQNLQLFKFSLKSIVGWDYSIDFNSFGYLEAAAVLHSLFPMQICRNSL